MRTHGLVQSTDILRQAVRQGIETDVSILLSMTPDICPHRLFLGDGLSIARVPFFWEDDIAMYFCSTWRIDELVAAAPHGLKVLNFHPIHIYLNSATFDSYQASKGSWQD